MRRILVLVVLIAIFAALYALSRSVASWQHYTLSGDPGALLYAASFDGGATDGFNSDWSQYPGRLSAAITGGQMQITIGAEDSGAYSVAIPHFTDFDLRVDAETLDGPVDNGYGVVFRLQNQDNTSVEDDSYYLFLISGDGYYQVSRAILGKVKILSDWIDSDAIHQGVGGLNQLRVVAKGDQFHFWINDQSVKLCIPDDPNGISTYSDGTCVKGSMVDALTDDTIANGQIGVSAQSTDTGGAGVVAGFDHLVVYAPG